MRFSRTSAAITPQVFTDVLQAREGEGGVDGAGELYPDLGSKGGVGGDRRDGRDHPVGVLRPSRRSGLHIRPARHSLQISRASSAEQTCRVIVSVR